MARYIDADKLVESLRADYDREGKKADTYAAYGDDDLSVKYGHGQFCYLNAMERVKDAPTADVAPIADTVQKMRGRFENAISELHPYYTDDSYEPMVFPSEVLELLDKIAKEMLEGQK